MCAVYCYATYITLYVERTALGGKIKGGNFAAVIRGVKASQDAVGVDSYANSG